MIVKRGTCSKCGHICCPPDCPSLTREGLCRIYSERPNGCRIYPHNPFALEKGCTYWFEEDTGDKITADNLHDFPEEKLQVWMKLTISRSLDE